jgi:hypothetical protein
LCLGLVVEAEGEEVVVAVEVAEDEEGVAAVEGVAEVEEEDS